MSGRLWGTFTDKEVTHIKERAKSKRMSTSQILQVGMKYYLEHSEDKWLTEEANKIDRSTEQYFKWEDR